MTFDRLIIAARALDPSERALVVAGARHRGVRAFAVPHPTRDRPRPGEEWFTIDRAGFRSVPGRGRTAKTVPLRVVRGPRDLDRILAEVGPGGTIALRWTRERIIPLEGVLARRPPGQAVWVVTERAAEVPGALGALERGADRVVLELSSSADLGSLDALVAPARPPRLRWGLASVTRIAAAGVSERVLVDTTSMLEADEGLLLGSSASLLFHVASEALGSRYTRPRPFRVNAGSPHSYVLMGDGTTRYLSELEPGDSVLVVRPKGKGRLAQVGRLKIERRPMLLVAATSKERSATIFLQEAETVRLFTAAGPRALTEILPGAKLLAVALPPARHLGLEVDETIEER